MARNPDDDVAEAIVAKWLATAALVAAVPGALEQDRGHTFQPDSEPKRIRKSPYAIFRVSKQADVEMSTCNRAIHHHKVAIEIRGSKAGISTALDILWRDPATNLPVFVRQPLAMTGANGGNAMAVLELLPDDEQRKDEKTKDQEDVWIGEHWLHVMSDRSYA